MSIPQNGFDTTFHVRRVAILVICAVLMGAAGCQRSERATATLSPPTKTESWQRSELYFGLSRRGGGGVSESEWQHFVDAQITPAFKDGLTVVDARGQWLNASGTICKENTKVLILLHPASAANDAAIQKIIDAYKQEFDQESVLWTRAPVEARF